MAEHADKKPSTTSGGAPKKKKWNNGRNKNTKRHVSKPAMQPAKFRGGKEELDGKYFDCTGYGQSDRFVKTVAKIVADLVGQDYSQEWWNHPHGSNDTRGCDHLVADTTASHYYLHRGKGNRQDPAGYPRHQ
jgi:hypothetical protein